MKNNDIDGIWNIRGIFQKTSKTIKMCKLLEYGIFYGIFQKNSKTAEILEILEYGIFLEYSKKYKTGHGGVKFNQEKK